MQSTKNTRNQEALYINTLNSGGSCLKEVVQEEKVIYRVIFNATLFNNGKNSRTITIPHLEMHSKLWHMNSMEYKTVSTMLNMANYLYSKWKKQTYNIEQSL